MRLLRAIALLCLLGCFGSPLHAQTPSPLQDWQFSSGIVLRKLFEPNLPDWQVTVGASTAVRPIYDGTATYRVSPAPAIDVRYSDIAFASVGDGVGVNVFRGDNYRIGVAVAYDLGRWVGNYPSHLRGLGNISPAPVVKLFAAYAVSKSFPLVLRATARRIVGASDGFLGDIGAYMPLPGSSRKFVMFAGPSLTVADSSYMETTFGVNSIQSANSGYPRYRARAGLKAAGLGFTATWFITDHWLLNTDAAVSRLLGSAAESPITQRRTQGTLTLTIAYMFSS
jgi:outer membrane scaffolding protein for murein synthesis (MipA/OmpV family)